VASVSRLNKQGFLLLEVIIAIAIVSIGLTVVLQALSFCAKSSALCRDITSAVFALEDRMQEMEFNARRGTIPDQTTQIKEKYGKFEFAYALKPLAGIDLRELNYDASWKSMNRDEKISLNTYLAK
jgi:prepilin-type N-terminal cleavage/methylation domain-containing protein